MLFHYIIDNLKIKLSLVFLLFIITTLISHYEVIHVDASWFVFWSLYISCLHNIGCCLLFRVNFRQGAFLHRFVLFDVGCCLLKLVVALVGNNVDSLIEVDIIK